MTKTSIPTKPQILSKVKFEDPETGNVVRETVEVKCQDFSHEILYNISEVNLTKPEKEKVERKAKAHFECPKVEEQVVRI